MTNEKLRHDGTFRAHRLGCKCARCEVQRQRMRTPPPPGGVCQNCDDSGYECQPSRADPTALYRPCLVCAIGRAKEADMIPRSLYKHHCSSFCLLDKVAIGPQIEVAGPQTPAEEITPMLGGSRIGKSRASETTPRKPNLCSKCCDTGYESHPCQADPIASYRVCTACDKGKQKDGSLVPRDYFRSYSDKLSGKTLHNSTVDGARKNVSDLVVFGNGDTFKLICKASSQAEGWMKSTKAMEIPGLGCVVQVTTQQGDNVAEALCFVPRAIIVDIDGDKRNGRALALVGHIFGGGKS